MPAVDSQSLREAVRRVQQGDESAREPLAEMLQVVAFHSISKLNYVDQDHFDDLAQVALVAMWEHVAKCDVSRNPYAFMRRVGYMKALQLGLRDRALAGREASLDELIDEGGFDERTVERLIPTKHEKVKGRAAK